MAFRDRALAAGARYVGKPFLSLPLPLSAQRAAFEMFGGPPRASRDLAERRVTLGGRPARIVAPVGGADHRLVWVHGGGFVMGSPQSHRGLCDALARHGLEVICPDYRLAPEHPFPAPVDDVTAALAEVLSEGAASLAGDSAGGTLALAALPELLARGLSPGALVLASPATRLDPDRPVPRHDEMLLPLPLLYRVLHAYAQDADPTDPRLSPVYADFTGAPRTLILAAKGEVLEEDSDAIDRRLREAGVEVTLEKTAGMPHAWIVAAGRAPKADRAVARVAAFVKGTR